MELVGYKSAEVVLLFVRDDCRCLSCGYVKGNVWLFLVVAILFTIRPAIAYWKD